MKKIPVIFPEVKINLDIEDISFNTIEELVFDVTRNIGQAVIKTVLHDIDEGLREGRVKGELENRGKKEKYLLTRLGDIRYKRTRYIDKWTGKARYLLEEKLGIKKNQRISLTREKIEMFIASVSSYRGTKENIELLTGYNRSHEAIRQSVLKEGKKIMRHQEYSIDKIERFEDEGARCCGDIAYMESDSVKIRLQRSKKLKDGVRSKKRKRKTIDVKLGIGYSGREERYANGKKPANRLKGKFSYIGICSGKKFMEKLSLIAEGKMRLSSVKNIFFGGDGASWIKTGIIDFFPGAIYLLCCFHLFRNIRGGLRYRHEEQKAVRRLIRGDKIDEGLKIIEKLIKDPRDEQEREGLKELYGYISSNRDGINALKRIEDKEIRDKVKRTGAIEPNIDKTIVHRFKRRGMSWSIKGALSLLKIKETIVNGEWDNWWYKNRDEKIELRTDKIKVLTAKDVLKNRGTDGIPLIEADIPALSGPDRNKPWAKLLRELSSIDYFSTAEMR